MRYVKKNLQKKKYPPVARFTTGRIRLSLKLFPCTLYRVYYTYGYSGNILILFDS